MTSYEIVQPTRPHKCDLPDAEDFPMGTVIRCTAQIRPVSSLRPPIRCDRKWLRSQTWFRNKPRWV